MAAIQHSYRYLAPSMLSGDEKPKLALSTSNSQAVPHPYFFEGRLKSPRLSANLLITLYSIIGTRFFTAINTLKSMGAFDPVVTSDGKNLRFEGFSLCCSAYVRVDLLPESYEGDVVGKGSTNVDFNMPMRSALARVSDKAGLSFAVGHDEFAVQSGAEKAIEKKVELPLRWIRGMLEVQSYQASMHKKIEVNGLEALRFIRSLPKSSTTRTPMWLVGGPFGLRVTTREETQGVRFVDSTRLRVLEPLLPMALSLAVYADELQQSSAWVLTFPGARMTLVLSAEIWRGFSGEGQALRALMRAGDASALAQVKANLHWQSSLRANALAAQLTLTKNVVEDALHILGASGLVGFDVIDDAYFHRVLPFNLSLIEDMHPRLAGARLLLEQGAVSITRHTPLDALVTSAGIEHRVREVDGELHCTCPWFASNQGDRGPCKHILAVEASTTIQGH
ncbi:SWIM zinc finger family protein [Undibacterium sp. Ji50W]|uniref:SWIM zinc finger family protein n=1 Tax=Undibacterium sp. Ji50W TaxID=3413041 RepID=UPI003BF4014A